MIKIGESSPFGAFHSGIPTGALTLPAPPRILHPRANERDANAG